MRMVAAQEWGSAVVSGSNRKNNTTTNKIKTGKAGQGVPQRQDPGPNPAGDAANALLTPLL